MLSDKLNKEFNEQIGMEFYSGYFYLAMAGWFEEHSLNGFASWMRIQSQEELSHAMIMFNFVQEAGGKSDLPSLAKPGSDFESALDIFKRGLDHEEYITSRINNLMDIALEERNHAASSFLKWFVDEQLEEESNFSTIIGKLELIEKGGAGGLFMVDNELSARTYVLPTPLVGKIDLGV